LLLAWFGGALAQKARKAQWKEYIYPEDNFAISAPASPGIYPDPQASDVHIYRWELAPQVIFTIHTGIRPNCLSVLATLKSSPPNSRFGENVPGSMKDISLNGYKGLEYETRLTKGRRAFERLYCTTQKSFSVTVAFPGNQTRPLEADRMFSSFRILNPSSR
jgi:hypothetical protein